MDRRPLVTTALVSVPALVLGLSIGGGAYAAHTIGKNLVVTKSIKNGAVTAAKLKADAVDGSKVKDASLTAADLAPGTIPAPVTPTPSKSIAGASTLSVNVGNDAATFVAPVGAQQAPGSVATFMVTPVAIQVGDLAVQGSAAQNGTNVLTVSLLAGPTFLGQTPVLTCTLQNGNNSCSSAQTATIPAHSFYSIKMVAGAAGAGASQVAVGYSVRVP
jgi:hypothetical protein